MIELSALEACQFFSAMFPYPGQKIIEIGCGNGYLSLELARKGHEVVGLDISLETIAMAEERELLIHWHRAGVILAKAGEIDSLWDGAVTSIRSG
jgi:2-polyprenyl-3-methyl-5-hydroxy-6-metoxy-1,4-benzoquinol methylase